MSLRPLGFTNKGTFRRAVALLAITAMMILTAACGTGGGGTDTGAAGDDTTAGGNGSQAAAVLKVGVLAPTSGSVAASGQDMINGWKLWFKLNGDTFGNVQIKYNLYDSASDPNTARTKAQQAVMQDGANVLVGGLLSSAGAAIASYARPNEVIYLSPIGSDDDFAQRDASPYILEVAGMSPSQQPHVAGHWAYEQGYRKVMTIAPAYNFGYQSTGGFAQTFVDAGGEIVEQLFPPLGTKDFSPYLAKVKSTNPDAVFVVSVGGDVLPFMQQWVTFGLGDKVPLIGNETFADLSNLRGDNSDLFLGVQSIGHWAPGREAKSTQDFVAAFEQEYGYIPGYFAPAMYTAAQWLSEAAKMVDNPKDSDAVLAAINGVSLPDSPLGPYKLDEYGGAIYNVYLREMVKTPAEHEQYGGMWNKVVRTWEDVSQFWTYEPSEYLKQPPYSQTYQGY